jgi:hypothetical protein
MRIYTRVSYFYKWIVSNMFYISGIGSVTSVPILSTQLNTDSKTSSSCLNSAISVSRCFQNLLFYYFLMNIL